MKLLGAILVAIPFAAAGLISSLGLTGRVKMLQKLCDFVYEIKESIRYSGSEINVILGNILSKKEYACFGNEFCNLSKPDQHEIKEILSGIGKTDTLGQLNYLDNRLKGLQSTLKNAEQESTAKANMYRTLGLLAGMAVAIIII